jgi:2-hydroxy-3-oxopropionate reductase
MKETEIGWIGLGNMGVPMLQRFLNAGRAVIAYDTRPEALDAMDSSTGTLRAAETTARVAEGCEVVFLSLPSIEAVRCVVEALLDSPKGRLRTIVNTGTTGASLSRELAASAARHGVRMVDCPVSGGPEAARAGVLSVMVSGGSAEIEEIRPLLLLWGKSIVVAGEFPGAAQTLKLVNNAIIVASYVSTLEAFLYGAKAGLEPQVMLDAINAGRLAHNGTTRVWLPDYILQGKPFGAQLHLLMKDMGLALGESEDQGVTMSVSAAALQVAARACSDHLPESADLMDLMTAMEDRVGFAMQKTRRQ